LKTTLEQIIPVGGQGQMEIRVQHSAVTPWGAVGKL